MRKDFQRHPPRDKTGADFGGPKIFLDESFEHTRLLNSLRHRLVWSFLISIFVFDISTKESLASCLTFACFCLRNTVVAGRQAI